MDFSERLNLYLEGGLLRQEDVEDINSVIELFKQQYGVMLCEENASGFIAHLAAAYGRLAAKEKVAEISQEVRNKLEYLESYPQSLKILNQIMQVTHNPLDKIEQEYMLLHINNLIVMLGENGQWPKEIEVKS